MDKNAQVNNLIKGCPVAMLCTPEPDGSTRMRPMVPPKQAFDGAVRFLIESTAAQFLTGKKSVPVSLGYVDPDGERFVSVTGNARLSEDKKQIDALWSDQFKAWFKLGKNDGTLRVLEVAVSRVEAWDAKKGGHTRLEL